MEDDIFEKDLSLVKAEPLPGGEKIYVVFSSGEHAIIDMADEIAKRKNHD